MARINIEETWWNSPRRRALRNLLAPREATEQVAINAWRVGYDYWTDKKGCSLIPGSDFLYLDGAIELIQAGLAILYKDTRLVDPVNFRTNLQHSPAEHQHFSTEPNTIKQCHVYLCGTRDTLLNLMEVRSKKSTAGQKSATRKRDARGRLLKKSTETPTPIQHSSNTVQLSSSSSVSSSIKKEELKATQNLPVPQPNQKLVTPKKNYPNMDIWRAQVIGTYRKSFKDRYGEETHPHVGGKEAKQIEAFLKSIPVDRFCALIQVYFQMNDKWFQDKAHDFETFLRNLNKVGIALDTGQNTSSTQTNWGKIEVDLNLKN